jgi:cell division control protein 24
LTNIIQASHDLRVSWKGDDDTEHFTLRCRNDEQLKLWENQINQLITAGRRRTGSGAGNSTSPAMARLHTGASEPSNLVTFQNNDYSNVKQPSLSSRSSIPHTGHPDANGFEPDDESDYMYTPSVYSGVSSGRGTPMGGRRAGAQSMPPERDFPPGYERPRARTEDYMGAVMQQWRVHGNSMPPPPPPATSVYSQRPTAGRMSSNLSSASDGTSIRGSLRTQQSMNKLRGAYETDATGDKVARSASAASGRSYSSQGSGSRMRSASISSPHSTKPPQIPPPLPAGYVSYQTGEARVLKRDSNSSNSTDHSSDFSLQQSGSPVTQYGSSDSSLMPSSTLRHVMSTMTLPNGGKSSTAPPNVKVKVHYKEDLFVIIVHRTTDYLELIDKVGKKIRLCGGRKEGSALRIKYRDEDGDMISLGSNEDVQMAFETSRTGQVTLFVS